MPPVLWDETTGLMLIGFAHKPEPPLAIPFSPAPLAFQAV
jgi:hypothetical protein